MADRPDVPLFAAGRALARACLRTVEGLWIEASAVAQDRWYGIDTATSAIDRQQPSLPDASPYEPLRYAAAHVVLREVALGHEDVFFDVGCGKGRMLCLVARQRLKKCVGIEYAPGLAAAAVANSRRARWLTTPIEVRTEDAAHADYSGATIVFFYNPFGVERLQQCLARIGESVSRQPRPIRIVYVNPVAAQAFRDCSWLRLVRTFDVPYRRRNDPSTVAIWEGE